MTDDKRRIAACLRACAGISTQNLEDNVPVIELARRYNVVLRERDALRAKIERMEQPESGFRERCTPSSPTGYSNRFPLYALPGAQNVPKAVAYLDLGTGGYMDIGTDLPDEALAALPKGRHMLGVIGTYGVDGYVPAQPAPSMPDVDSLAQFIREVDGSHQLGAGVLAERIAEWLKAAKEAKP